MSTISTFLQNAVTAAATGLPGCTAVVKWGDESVAYTAIKSKKTAQKSGFGASSTITEAERFILFSNGAELPRVHDAIMVDGARRIVTSCVSEATDVQANIGTSAAMADKLVIRGSRLENGIVRSAAQTMDCLVFGGDFEQADQDINIPTFARRWDVVTVGKNWLDHKLPQNGDTVEVVGYPPMTVVSVFQDRDMFGLACRSSGEDTHV
jgi:hypothetical protein